CLLSRRPRRSRRFGVDHLTEPFGRERVRVAERLRAGRLDGAWRAGRMVDARPFGKIDHGACHPHARTTAQDVIDLGLPRRMERDGLSGWKLREAEYERRRPAPLLEQGLQPKRPPHGVRRGGPADVVLMQVNVVHAETPFSWR